ncbi:MAG TPA: DedA family protein [Bacteroidota bacterium]|nr:DedA family protein [Bacteroidota bacterium]
MPDILQVLVASLRSLDPSIVCLTLFSIALLENIFPPFPSDLVIVFGGSLIGAGRLSFAPALISASAGGTIGFVIMFGIGRWFGEKILVTGRIRFIQRESVERVDAWFRRYGYWLIVANRFIAGTRTAVSFVAGMSGIGLFPTIVLCTISALTWNAVLLAGGYYLGDNWARIGGTLAAYSAGLGACLALVLLVLGVLYMRRRLANGARR